MMSIFDEIGNDIPLFAESVKHMYENKRTALVGEKHNKVVPLAHLREELFFPKSETNQSTSLMVAKLGRLSDDALLKELQDTSKSTAEHLSRAGGKFSLSETSSESHMEGMHILAVNNPADRSFGGITRQIQYFG